MTEDEMMLLNQIKQQNEDLKRKSENSGGCGKTLLGIVLLIVALRYCAPEALDLILYGEKGKPKTEQVEEKPSEPSDEETTPQSTPYDNSTTTSQHSEQPVERSQPEEKRYSWSNSIGIDYIQMHGPDEYGNVAIELTARNTSQKNIRRVSFNFSFTDSNGNKVQDLQTGGMNENALIDGPFARGEKFGDIWSIYNNPRATGYVLNGVVIIYDDGSTIATVDTKRLMIPRN